MNKRLTYIQQLIEKRRNTAKLEKKQAVTESPVTAQPIEQVVESDSVVATPEVPTTEIVSESEPEPVVVDAVVSEVAPANEVVDSVTDITTPAIDEPAEAQPIVDESVVEQATESFMEPVADTVETESVPAEVSIKKKRSRKRKTNEEL